MWCSGAVVVKFMNTIDSFEQIILKKSTTVCNLYCVMLRCCSIFVCLLNYCFFSNIKQYSYMYIRNGIGIPNESHQLITYNDSMNIYEYRCWSCWALKHSFSHELHPQYSTDRAWNTFRTIVAHTSGLHSHQVPSQNMGRDFDFKILQDAST